jgi:germination protein M
MKKMSFCFFFCLSLLGLLLTGCGRKDQEKKEDIQLYLMGRDNSHIAPIEYEMDTSGLDKEQMIEQLLTQLESFNEEVDYQPVISGFTVQKTELDGEQLTLDMSEEYRWQTAVKEVLTRAAIVKTLTQIEGVDYVTILVNGEELEDNLGNVVGAMSADSFVDNTGADMKKYEEITLTLYFTDEDGDKLIKVNRSLRYNTNVSVEKLVVEQLISGPAEKNSKNEYDTIFPTINPATKIINVSIQDETCYVSLDSTFLTSVNNVSAQTTIYSLVNSLCELSGVSRVQIAIDGETEIRYQEKYDLSTLFEPNPDLVQTGDLAGE